MLPSFRSLHGRRAVLANARAQLRTSARGSALQGLNAASESRLRSFKSSSIDRCNRSDQLSGRAKAIFRILSQQTIDEWLQTIQRFVQRWDGCIAMHVDHCHRCGCNEWLSAGEHLVKHDSQTVEVASRVQIATMPLLRTHVERRAENHTRTSNFQRLLRPLSQPKIDQR